MCEIIKEMNNKSRLTSNQKALVLMILPVLIYIVLFKFIPFAGNIIAFEDFKILSGIFNSEWVGLKHFQRLFSSDIFYAAFSNTLRINFLELVVGFPFTILLSIMLVEINRHIRPFLQICLYIPFFISWSALGGMIVQMLSPSVGLPAAIGSLFGFGYSEIPFLLGNEKSWLVVFVLSEIWQSAGWGTIIYVSSILNMNPSVYEAAKLDGASRFYQCIHLTIPLLKPTIIIMFILKIGGLLSTSFEQVYALSNPLVTEVSDVLSTYEYRVGLQGMQFSFATAIGIFERLVGIVLVFVTRHIIKKYEER